MSLCKSEHDLRSRMNNLSGPKGYFELRINMIHFIYFNSCPLTCRAFIRASWLIDPTCANKPLIDVLIDIKLKTLSCMHIILLQRIWKIT